MQGTSGPKHLHHVLAHLRFMLLDEDQCIFVHGNGPDFVMLFTCVDNLLLTGASNKAIMQVKRKLQQLPHEAKQGKPVLDINALGPTGAFFSIVFSKIESGILVCQSNYMDVALRKFPKCVFWVTMPISAMQSKASGSDMLSPSGTKLYQPLLDLLVHFATVSCPDLAYTVSFAAWYASMPAIMHLKALHQTLLILAKTCMLRFAFHKTGEPHFGLTVYVDAFYADDVETRRTTSGLIILVSSVVVSWVPCHQP